MAGPWDKYAPAQTAPSGPWDKYAPAAEDQPHSNYTPTASKPTEPPQPLAQQIGGYAEDFGKGALKSIGGTLDTIGAPAGWAAKKLGLVQETPEQRQQQEQLFKPENKMQAAGAGLGDAAQAMVPVERALPYLGKLIEALPIPTRAKAGKLFGQVMEKAANEPVRLSKSMDELTRAQELMKAGGGSPTPVNALLKRLDSFHEGPLTYKEARDYAPNLSGLSATDKMGMSNTLHGQVGKLAGAFNEDVGAAAERAGVGPQYAKAMRDYARASRNAEIAGSIGSKARKLFPYVAYPAGGYLGYKVLNETLPK